MIFANKINELNRLEAYFNSFTLPNEPIILDGFMQLNDLKNFIKTQFNHAQQNNNWAASGILWLRRLEDYFNENSNLKTVNL